MEKKARLLAICGSTRSGSFNRKLLANAIEGARSAGAVVTELDLRDYPMPLYDGDLEEREGIPKPAMELKALLGEQDGFLIASPEYNGFFSSVLKNTLDWISRPVPDTPSLISFKGKVAAIMAASPGGLGGVRGLQNLRVQLANLQMVVLPDQVTLSGAHKAFDGTGRLVDEKVLKRTLALGEALVRVAARMKDPA